MPFKKISFSGDNKKSLYFNLCDFKTTELKFGSSMMEPNRHLNFFLIRTNVKKNKKGKQTGQEITETDGEDVKPPILILLKSVLIEREIFLYFYKSL